MTKYEAVIGLEVHAQLATQTKLFCACRARFGDEPNENVCEVCAGLPGVLPVLNEKAVEYAVRAALALDCTVNRRSVFARKNYFYPDLPKGYQISQYEAPLSEHGFLDVEVGGTTKRLGITRIHMEEDAGKNIHSATENISRVDLNRCGTPLIEIVGEPDLRSAEEAQAYLKALHAVLTCLGVCDGNMDEGSFRCDANVSIRPVGQAEFGTRAELKNLNSFKFVKDAIEYEIKRQEALIEDGGTVVQETRLYDSAKGKTFSMRGKEEAHDYRYFPDPDLIPLVVEADFVERVRAGLPELPRAKRERFVAQYGLTPYDAETLTGDAGLAAYFERAVAVYDAPKKIANWMSSELLRELNAAGKSAKDSSLSPETLAELVELVETGCISGKIGKDLFPELFAKGLSPKKLVEEKGLSQISDACSLEAVVEAVVAENPKEVEAYRGGKTKLMGFFVGQIMKKTQGKANPALVNDLIKKKLG